MSQFFIFRAPATTFIISFINYLSIIPNTNNPTNNSESGQAVSMFVDKNGTDRNGAMSAADPNQTNEDGGTESNGTPRFVMLPLPAFSFQPNGNGCEASNQQFQKFMQNLMSAIQQQNGSGENSQGNQQFVYAIPCMVGSSNSASPDPQTALQASGSNGTLAASNSQLFIPPPRKRVRFNLEEVEAEQKIPLCDDVIRELITFINRPELGYRFSLTSRNFHELAHSKMHKENPHIVQKVCHLVGRWESGRSLIVLRDADGRCEMMPIPEVPPPENILGFRSIRFNGILVSEVIKFLCSAIHPAKTLYRMLDLKRFYDENEVDPIGQPFSDLEKFLKECVQHIQFGNLNNTPSGQEFKGFMTQLIQHSRVQSIRWGYRDFEEDYRKQLVDWLHIKQKEGEKRRLLVIDEPVDIGTQDKFIEDLVEFFLMTDCESQRRNFCVKLRVRDDSGGTLTRRPQALVNHWTGEVLYADGTPMNDDLVEVCVVRCGGEQRVQSAEEWRALVATYSAGEPECTVDVADRYNPNTSLFGFEKYIW